MIVSERREGSLKPELDSRAGYAPHWKALDRNVPLAVKLVLPIIAITMLGTALFGYMIVQQSTPRRVTETVVLIVLAGLAVGALEVGSLAVIMELGVLRRIRRMQRAVQASTAGPNMARLSEADEPHGRDVLFNLAREVALKLSELAERERAGRVVTDLGTLALQGAEPSTLTARALELLRQAAGLERCMLVDRDKPGAVRSASEEGPSPQVSEQDLPVWLAALARTAARSRKPVLAGRLGQFSRYWDGQSDPQSVSAVFVPMPGKLVATGVMVGLAVPGGQLSSSTVSLMEGVAIALSESLERNEASRARQESEDKSRALATVSHEMRNPLNAMLGFSDLLLSGAAGQLNEKQLKYMQQVEGASRHLLQLVDDYLDLSRAAAGSLPVKIEAVAVGPEVQSVLELMGPTAEARHVVMRSVLAEGAVAQTDRLRLRQVLVNLVINAIRSTPARGHVRVEVAGGSNGVRISVIDTGLGIPADRQHLVFSEFAELRPGERSEGTGLGLALSKRFVEAMGGFIQFTSSDGAGTIFDVWLPGENSPHQAEAQAAAEPTLFRSS